MVWKCPNTAVKVRTIEIRPTFGQNKLEWIRHNKMAYDNITGRNLSGLCDFNDDFLHMEGKFVENVLVVNGWKVWMFVEGTSTSDILICDYFVREN